MQVSEPAKAYLKRKVPGWRPSVEPEYPWRTTSDPYAGLIAEILLQRTRAEQVIPVYERFLEELPTPHHLAKAAPPTIRRIIRPLGLLWRAPLLKQLGVALVDEYGGDVPDSLDDLLRLPGVGPYAAGAYLSFHGNKSAPIIDSNVVRLYGRYFGFETGPETRRTKMLLSLAKDLTPSRTHKRFNYAVLDLSRSVCKPSKPLCDGCPLRRKCATRGLP